MTNRLWILLICVLTAGSAKAEVTFAREVSRILQAKCAQCHRPNDIAPFALNAFEAVLDWKDDIRRVVSERTMPPWKPVDGHGEFRGNFGLTEQERNQIIEWIDAGAPFGDEADLPEPLPDTGEWVLGEPDLVLEMPEAYTPPRGQDMYRCFVLPTDSDLNRFVSAVDILPGNRRYVHHVILYLDSSGVAEKLDADEEGPGYTCFGGPRTPVAADASLSALLGNGIGLGGWAPGTRPTPLPDGVGMHLPPKARIVMQVHYYARGGTGPDQTKVGLYFSKGKVEKRLMFIPIVPLDSLGRVSMRIPAGADNHEIKAEFLVPPLLDAHLVNIFPHMHLLGKEIKSEVVRLNGRVTPLVYIDKWDFNWQGAYSYKEQIPLPAFSRIRLSCTYDNSENNPRNPSNPLKTVTWGEGTEDEMCLVFLGLTFDRERLQ
ncbi:MAG: ascorbate-dependent monooxygenase [Acidimicrobiia bacterium]|nr:ascorbate-dependent monooxygenase [Acidimicrobiia bacterium]